MGEKVEDCLATGWEIDSSGLKIERSIGSDCLENGVRNSLLGVDCAARSPLAIELDRKRGEQKRGRCSSDPEIDWGKD